MAYALIALPPLMGFWFVHAFGMNVVWGDHWAVAELLKLGEEGSLGVSDFFIPNGEQRMFFPMLTAYLLAKVSGFNNFWETYLIEFCLLLVVLIYLREYRRTKGCNSPLYFFPVAFLVFSPVQFTNMLWGARLAVIYALLFSAASFHLLSSYAKDQRASRVALAVVTGLVASFSNANGLFVWPAGLLALLATGTRKRRPLPVLIWAAFGMASWTLYFNGLVHPAQHPPVSYIFLHPLAGMAFIAGGLGGWFPFKHIHSFAIGALVMAFSVAAAWVLVKRRLFGRYHFWAALSAFSILSIFSVAVGRAGFGAAGSVHSRYTTFAIPHIISLYVVIVSLANEEGAGRLLRRAPRALLALFALIVVPLALFDGLVSGESYKRKWEVTRAVLFNYDRLPAQALTPFFPDAAFLVEHASYLKERRLNAFSGEPEGVVFYLDGTYIVIEEVGGAKAVPGKKVMLAMKGGDVVIKGRMAWPSGIEGGDIVLTLDGVPLRDAAVEPRSLFLELGGAYVYESHAFKAVAPTGKAAKGGHEIRAAWRDAEGHLSHSSEHIDVEVE